MIGALGSSTIDPSGCWCLRMPGRHSATVRAMMSGKSEAVITPLLLQRQFTSTAFQQELEDLDVPSGLGQILAPRIQPVPANQKCMKDRPFSGRQARCDLARHGRDVL